MSTTYEGKVDNLNSELIEKLGEDKRKNPGLPTIDLPDYGKRLFDEKEGLLKRMYSYIRLMLGLRHNDYLHVDIIVPGSGLEYSFDSPGTVNVRPEKFHEIFISAVEIIAKELKINPYSVESKSKA